MKDRIEKFCKEMENYLGKKFNSINTDFQEFDYLLGQKKMSWKIRSIVGNTKKQDKNIIKEIQNLKKEWKELEEKANTIEKTYYVGGQNFVSYVLRDLEKGGFIENDDLL